VVIRWPCGTVAEVVDDDDGYRTLWSKWSCLGGSWWRDDAQGGSRGQGEDGVDGARPCTVVPVDVAMHALACLGIVGMSCAGQGRALLGQWRA
jgi:hypothetical protein